MKKEKLSVTVDSALALMQEIYNDIIEQKTTATIITKKMLKFMTDSDDMAVIGPVIKDQQKILNDCTEKKISLVKMQSILLKQLNGEKVKDSTKLTLSDEDKEILEKLMRDEKIQESGSDIYKI